MARSDEDASFLRSIPNGVLEEFRAEVFELTYALFLILLPYLDHKLF